jgi:hypothetical protein
VYSTHNEKRPGSDSLSQVIDESQGFSPGNERRLLIIILEMAGRPE